MSEPPNKPRLLVSLCTYNERENIEALIPAIQESAPDADVVVIDDNSPDGTGDLADRFAASDPRVRAIHRTGKQGLGTAILAGFRYAIEHGYDQLLNMDADFSHHPRYIPALREAMERADVAVGSRYVPGGGVEGWNWWRHFMSTGVNTYARWLLWLRTHDTSGAFRCYSVPKLRQLDLDRVVSRGYSFQEEILYRCRRIGCRIEEVPILFENRRHGSSKINWREAASALGIIARLGAENVLRVPVSANESQASNP